MNAVADHYKSPPHPPFLPPLLNLLEYSASSLSRHNLRGTHCVRGTPVNTVIRKYVIEVVVGEARDAPDEGMV